MADPIPPYPPQASAGYRPEPAPAPPPDQAKKARATRWTGYVVIALALLRLGLWLLPAAPKACDDPDTQSVVTQAINEAVKKQGQAITLTALSSIVTLPSTDDEKQCRAQGTFSDGEKAPILYTVTGKEVRARIGSAPYPPRHGY